MVWAFSCCNNPKFSNLKVSHPQNIILLEITQVILAHSWIPRILKDYNWMTAIFSHFYVNFYDVNEGKRKTQCIISFWTYLIFSHNLVFWKHLLQLKQQCFQLFEKNRYILRILSVNLNNANKNQINGFD